MVLKLFEFLPLFESSSYAGVVISGEGICNYSLSLLSKFPFLSLESLLLTFFLNEELALLFIQFNYLFSHCVLLIFKILLKLSLAPLLPAFEANT